MTARTLLLAVMLFQLAGCVATPRIEIAERLTFDAPLPNRMPMSYNDLLCCYDCTA